MSNIQIEEQTEPVTGATRYCVRVHIDAGHPGEEAGLFETVDKARSIAGIIRTALQHIHAASDTTLMFYLQKSGFAAPLSFEARHEPQQWWQRETQKESADWPYWIVERDWSGYGVHHLGYLPAAAEAQSLCACLNRLVVQALTRRQTTTAAPSAASS